MRVNTYTPIERFLDVIRHCADVAHERAEDVNDAMERDRRLCFAQGVNFGQMLASGILMIPDDDVGLDAMMGALMPIPPETMGVRRRRGR